MTHIDLRSPSFTDIIKEHAARYPKTQPRDLIKLAYQSEFGPGHMISDEKSAIDFLRNEISVAVTDSSPHIESIGEKYSRIYLKQIDGLSQDDLVSLYGELFLLSSREQNGSLEKFEEKISEIRKIVCSGVFSFDLHELDNYLKEYRMWGMTAVSHTSEYRAAYTPSYRVVKKEFASLLPLLILLKKKGHAVIAIDGFCGAGKSTIAALLADLLDADLVHTDDFFLPPSKRTPERYAEPGGNIDYERLSHEVIQNIRKESFSYGVFDCASMQISSVKHVGGKNFTIIEGAYSMHPFFNEYWDIALFIETNADEQRRRIVLRDGIDSLRMFEEKWIPLEKRYESFFKIRERVDFLIQT